MATARAPAGHHLGQVHLQVGRLRRGPGPAQRADHLGGSTGGLEDRRATSWVTVVLPFVPVTPTVCRERAGWPQKAAATGPWPVGRTDRAPPDLGHVEVEQVLTQQRRAPRGHCLGGVPVAVGELAGDAAEQGAPPPPADCRTRRRSPRSPTGRPGRPARRRRRGGRPPSPRRVPGGVRWWRGGGRARTHLGAFRDRSGGHGDTARAAHGRVRRRRRGRGGGGDAVVVEGVRHDRGEDRSGHGTTVDRRGVVEDDDGRQHRVLGGSESGERARCRHRGCSRGGPGWGSGRCRSCRPPCTRRSRRSVPVPVDTTDSSIAVSSAFGGRGR